MESELANFYVQLFELMHCNVLVISQRGLYMPFGRLLLPHKRSSVGGSHVGGALAAT